MMTRLAQWLSNWVLRWVSRVRTPYEINICMTNVINESSRSGCQNTGVVAEEGLENALA